MSKKRMSLRWGREKKGWEPDIRNDEHEKVNDWWRPRRLTIKESQEWARENSWESWTTKMSRAPAQSLVISEHGTYTPEYISFSSLDTFCHPATHLASPSSSCIPWQHCCVAPLTLLWKLPTKWHCLPLRRLTLVWSCAYSSPCCTCTYCLSIARNVHGSILIYGIMKKQNKNDWGIPGIPSIALILRSI